MQKHENFVDVLNGIRAMLGWSVEHLADRLDNRYSIEFLRKVCAGRPLGEVEQKIVRALVAGLADKIEDSIELTDLPTSAGAVARRAYLRVVDSFSLRLEDSASLAAIACNRVASAQVFRTQTVSVMDLEFWDSVLGSIAREINQGTLFQVEHNRFQGGDEHALITYPPTRSQEASSESWHSDYYSRPPSECWNCHRPTWRLTSARCDCGQFWNIAN